MNILLTAIGKRVQLINHLKGCFNVIGTDSSAPVSSSFFVDDFYQVSRYDFPDYVDFLLQICKTQGVHILLPLFEPEFRVLDMAREYFRETGVLLLLSDTRVLNICRDKWNTYDFFYSNGFNTPNSLLEIEGCKSFPLFIKPRTGMGSHHAFKVKDFEELHFYCKRIKNPIIQEFVEGIEYTIDCLCDLEGNAISIVPRERIEVRSGEVSKSRTCRDFDIIDATVGVCNKLGAIGPITIQCIKTADGYIKFIEINPRLGGGVPLTFEAGVDYGRIIKDMVSGKRVEPIIGQFKEVTMLRYDEAVFI